MKKLQKIGLFIIFIMLLFAYGIYSRIDELHPDGYILKKESAFKDAQTDGAALKAEFDLALYYERQKNYKKAKEHYENVQNNYANPHDLFYYLQDEAKYRALAIESIIKPADSQ